MALYDTRFGLGQNVVDYLNQPMPDVSGIRSLYQPSVLPTQPVPELGNVGLTPEQMLLLRSNLIPQGYGNDGGDGGYQDEDTTIGDGSNLGINSLSDVVGSLSGNFNIGSFLGGLIGGPLGSLLGNKAYENYKNPYTNITGGLNKDTRDAIDAQGRDSAPGRGDAGNPGGSSGAMDDSNAGSFCFDPKTPIQMADGSTKQIKNIQLGDDTKGGEVTGVFQFKAADEIHDYKGITVAGSHFVKEDGRFIMVKDSPLSVKIDKIPVVYSLDTSGRRIFIKDIEFADYNGDGVAKNFLNNAGVDLSGFDKEVLRQVEQRLL